MTVVPAPEVLARHIHQRLVDGPWTEAGPSEGDVVDLVRADAPLLTDAEVASTVRMVRERLDGLGPLQPFLADPAVTEVMVNGGGDVWVEREGRLRLVARVDDDTTRHLVERVLAPLGLRVDRVQPMADARLADGSRVNVVIPPLAIDGPCLTIRRFATDAPGLDAFCPPEVGALLRWAVDARQNVVVSGATGAGKTSLLGALGAMVGPTERVITVEDAAELRLPGRHVVRLEARPPNADGVGGVRVRDLLRNALRMRPDRIVVGEVRGAEAFDMVQALSTGHDGSLSTCHANGPLDAIRRLEALAAMAGVGLPAESLRGQLAAAIDLVVHVSRRPDGRRVVASVHEVEVRAADGDPLSTRCLADEHGIVAGPLRAARAHGAAPYVAPRPGDGVPEPGEAVA